MEVERERQEEEEEEEESVPYNAPFDATAADGN